MAILTLKSGNPKLSYVIVKNPESGMTSRKIRQGLGYGWYTSNQEYNLYFQDGVDCDSFSNSDFEYLSQAKYGHPLAYSSLLSTFLRDVFKKEQENDHVYNQEIVLNQLAFKGKRLLDHLVNHLPVDVTFDEIEPCIFKATFKGECTLHRLVTCVMISMLFLAGEEGVYLTKVNESFMDKYAKIIQDLDLPYFLRYIFARNYFKSKDQFGKYASMLETENIKLEHGDTGMQRLRFIEKLLDNSLSILDVGCGEGVYALNLPKRNPFTYHAIDIDEDLTESVQKKADARGLDVQTYNNIDEYAHDNTVDILCVEVIEHMPLEDAEKLVSKLLGKNFRNLIITTPNKSFNKHYLIGEGDFRHDDHDWEMTEKEFQDWIFSLIENSGLDMSKHQIELLNIGDSVDGVHTTQGLMLTCIETKPQVIFTCGVSASGKSTWAEKVCKQDGWVEINRDNVRFKGKEKDWTRYSFTKKNENFVTKKCDKLIHNAVENRKNIVISDTNLSKKRLEDKIKWFEDKGYDWSVKFFDIDFEDALKRDTQRQGGVGYEVLLNQYIRYQQEYKGVERYSPLPEKPLCYVVDIDGTLVDHGDRSPFDLSKVYEDSVVLHVSTLVESARLSGVEIVFLSGRNVSCDYDTRRWLSDKLGDWTDDCKLFMRSDGDNRKDYIVKMELFDKYVRNQYTVLAAIDDRKQVIESCWDVLGVNVINVGKILRKILKTS